MKLLSQKLANTLGLGSYESRVFVALSRFEKANISQIARASGIPRTAVYPSIKSLLDKGLISFVLIGKRRHYKALSPKQLESTFEKKKADLSFVAKELSRMTSEHEGPLEVLYFPGRNGLNSAAEVFLKNTKGKLWKTFESATINQPTLEFYQLEDYVKRRLKKNIKARVVLTINMMYPWLKERLDRAKEDLIEVLLVSEKIFPFDAVIAVNENSTLILSGEEAAFGMVIKNAQIARTLGTIHDMIWSRYKTE